MPIMAYSPLDQGGRLLRAPLLGKIAARHGATPAQIALAWLLQQPQTVVIPKSVKVKRIAENLAATEIELSATDLQALDVAFSAPVSAVRLGMR